MIRILSFYQFLWKLSKIECLKFTELKINWLLMNKRPLPEPVPFSSNYETEAIGVIA